MANAALGYMNNAESNMQSSDPVAHWNWYRVATLFDAIFGAQDAAANTRWDTVKSNLQALANLANNQPDMYVLCDDSQFWSVSPSQGQPTVFRNPVDNQAYNYPNGVMTCADSSPEGLYQIAYQINIGGTQFISICSRQNSYNSNLSPGYSEGTTLDSLGTWSTTFLHEIMHALPLNQVGDSTGGTAAGGERYGWSGAVSIRQDYGERNPDSYRLFAMALSMEEWLWHSGQAVSFNAEYDRLDKDANDATITNLNLPSPAPGPWQ
ncbi:uncharacterized protein LTR77_011092 [Saxophila tyrrhenica]|uniref:Uncharacterized protein n=1 Tax=Saxophila tyrrhenica TaxID=1690608 RepID=A0AAV9NWZ8_9PEZI|nr:hypothetical protein LTR77_011092 [Saxophila tyrrhenica]